ncbi:branched-chain amino acid ABC transporter permease [Elioraea sp. Yellowstone]|jgi:branched-chain amino acid transport system permease protein|uniref:branched-chain amino acid ABC transporter permease n=1 Tax=Elioraea sp. Yellowstone TaxID=2592070 RepID=UPI00114D6666|nr:branched-chain amino acid ABC transporter permease [Elioraea sp. Yellowstone]TQF83105.1 branched-chain amino acid ABC transporter permease [Elioraea sp. Yellowstone]
MREPAPPHVRRGWIAAQAGLAVLVAAPFVLTALDRAWLLPTLTRMLAYGLGAAALDVVLGYGGLVSFGHGAFLGTGAYVAGALIHHAGAATPLLRWPVEIDGSLDALIAFPAAALAAGALAFLIGAVSLRTRGVHFIMITLAFAQMVYFLVLAIPEYGGTDGLMLPARHRLFDLPLDGDQPLYWVALVLLVGFLTIAQRSMEARFGLALRGARQNERRMRALGYPVFRIRLVAFTISGAVAGLAGAVLANQAGFVSPDLLSWQRSGELIIMVILGGQGTLFGPVLGAFALLLLEEELSAVTEHWMLVLGPLLLACVLFFRRGLWGQVVRAPAHG